MTKPTRRSTLREVLRKLEVTTNPVTQAVYRQIIIHRMENRDTYYKEWESLSEFTKRIHDEHQDTCYGLVHSKQ